MCIRDRCFPLLFEVEEVGKRVMRGFIKPFFRKLGLYRMLCECAPLLYLLRLLRMAWRSIMMFRWLPSWCPTVVQRLRKEMTAEEEDALNDEEATHGQRDDDDDEG